MDEVEFGFDSVKMFFGNSVVRFFFYNFYLEVIVCIIREVFEVVCGDFILLFGFSDWRLNVVRV